MPLPRIVLDCRWLNSGGAGRVTELLLRGLAADPGEADWILWGPPELQALAWPGCEIALQPQDPRARNGQAHWFSLPEGDLTLFMHQQRPLRRVPSVTYIYDTIPLRFAANRLDRMVKRRFLRRVASISERVVTPSEYSRDRVLSDLRVPASRVAVVGCPADDLMAGRVCELRRSLPPEPFALYLGLFLPHKNLERLIQAFGSTGFRSEGGRLLLMGGSRAEHADLEARLTAAQREYVQTRPFGSQQDLERLMATCRFLVQPSLEEGFGLPAWEALCCGVPVCASDGGSLPEVTRGRAEEFPASSTEAMTAALDACAARAASATPEAAEAASKKFMESAPTIEQTTAQLREIVIRAAASA